MNRKIFALLLFSIVLSSEVIYVFFIYEPAYTFSCDGELSYNDSKSKDLLDGNISFSLNDKMQGHAEITGFLTNNGLTQNVIRSVDFKYRVPEAKHIVIYDAQLVTYFHDSTEKSFSPEPILDFLFFRNKDLKEINVSINKVKNTYLFGRANSFVFVCTS